MHTLRNGSDKKFIVVNDTPITGTKTTAEEPTTLGMASNDTNPKEVLDKQAEMVTDYIGKGLANELTQDDAHIADAMNYPPISTVHISPAVKERMFAESTAGAVKKKRKKAETKKKEVAVKKEKKSIGKYNFLIL
jgi:hypothetical protein